jgi:hypothetical protein
VLLKEVWRVRARAVPRVAAAAAAAAAINEAARVYWGLLGLVWRGVVPRSGGGGAGAGGGDGGGAGADAR